MERLICIGIGYIFGLFQTGYIYGKLHHVDIRKMGSGNAGSTNALRTLGIKAGAVTFFGDCFKCIFAVLIARLIFGNTKGDILPLLSMYAGLGAVLGHNFPFYMKFKGGKGIAAMAGLLAATTNIWICLIALAVFVTIVAATKYVSVGSIAVVIIFFSGVVVRGQIGDYGMEGAPLYEMYAVAGFLALMAIWKHRANIGRLLNGTENKISFGKKK
nr:glycerol-3-phosphate 1-O-acyltransferase PlsY [uncultured Sellimonas sp.]